MQGEALAVAGYPVLMAARSAGRPDERWQSLVDSAASACY
jgi:hypothetical protein